MVSVTSMDRGRRGSRSIEVTNTTWDLTDGGIAGPTVTSKPGAPDAAGRVVSTKIPLYAVIFRIRFGIEMYERLSR